MVSFENGVVQEMGISGVFEKSFWSSNRLFSTGRFIAPNSDHMMILLRIFPFKFSNSCEHMNK